MLRYGLLGGTRPPLPWEFFITLGGAALVAGVLYVVLFPFWSTYPAVGLVETAAFGVAGSILIAVGGIRRGRTPKRA